MIADAYYYTIGEGDKPHELELFDNIQTYGAQAVLGRVLHYREINRCNMARAVRHIKRKSMDNSEWSEWVKKNPKEAEFLAQIEKIVAELEHAG